MSNAQLAVSSSTPIVDTLNRLTNVNSTLQQRVHYLGVLMSGGLRQEFCNTKSNGPDVVPPPMAPADSIEEALANSLSSALEATAELDKLIEETKLSYHGIRIL